MGSRKGEWEGGDWRKQIWWVAYEKINRVGGMGVMQKIDALMCAPGSCVRVKERKSEWAGVWANRRGWRGEGGGESGKEQRGRDNQTRANEWRSLLTRMTVWAQITTAAIWIDAVLSWQNEWQKQKLVTPAARIIVRCNSMVCELRSFCAQERRRSEATEDPFDVRSLHCSNRLSWFLFSFSFFFLSQGFLPWFLREKTDGFLPPGKTDRWE